MLAFDLKLPLDMLGERNRMKKETVGERIRRARERAGLNQSELARRLGIRPQSVQQWESELNQPKGHKRYEAIGKVLGVSPQWLEYGEDAKLPAIDVSLLQRLIEVVEAAETELGVETTPAQRAQIVTDLYKVVTKDFTTQPKALEAAPAFAALLLQKLRA